MNIGNKIKELRKQRGVTQEQLANSIGISCQAVSKWETGITLPDITLAPILACYFGVSMDELFEFNLKEIELAIDNIVNEAYQFRASDPQRSRTVLEEGLKKYPDNEVLLNNLLYVLNYSKDPDETIAIANSLIEKTNQVDIQYDALRFLAYAYKVKGDLKSAEAAIEQIPEIYFTKLTERAYLLEGKSKYEAAEKQKWISFENLIQMMEKLAEYYESEGMMAAAKKERENARKLIALVENSAYDAYVGFFNKKIKNNQNSTET